MISLSATSVPGCGASHGEASSQIPSCSVHALALRDCREPQDRPKEGERWHAQDVVLCSQILPCAAGELGLPPAVTVGLRENTADITGSQHLRELFQARNLIPKVLHQTYKAYEMTDDLEQKVNTWLTKNPGWELRLYNDTDSLELFERRFPQWAGAYKGLAKHVERADFFR